ncbi:hypothetical protein [Lentzea sp. NPDC003310]|uniref:hypothetical protein n=1 Tax=Lentzea sp. NPDC003310 TaxID=3154447 RepID=UPI0033A55EE6
MKSGGELGIAAARRLAELNCCEIAPGLTDAEFAAIEAEHGFEFADDHRAFLAAGLPVNTPFEPEEGVIHTWTQPWPEWRDGDPDQLRRRVDYPVVRILDEVRSGDHWNAIWGERPTSSDDAVALARRAMRDVPRLVPVYGHRFLPAGRGTSGFPVLSAWGTDIVIYGLDLADYVDQEFGNPVRDNRFARKSIPFWWDYL